jgi:hypothetical protein
VEFGVDDEMRDDDGEVAALCRRRDVVPDETWLDSG